MDNELRLYETILKKLEYYHTIMATNRRDTKAFMNADNKEDKLIFNNISIKKLYLLAKKSHRKMTLKDLAEAITLTKVHKSVPKAFHLSMNATLSYTLIEYQEESGLTQTDFAKKYNISQSKLSKMESGQLRVDVNDFYRILHNMQKRFLMV